MKKIMWLCDMGGSFIDRDGDFIRQDVMDKIVEFKTNEGDVAAMATDGDADYAYYTARGIGRNQPNGQSPFDMLISQDTFRVEKTTHHYWRRLTETYGDDYALVLMDDRFDIRDLGAQYNVSGIDMSLSRSSDAIIQDMETTRQKVALSLNA